MTFTNATKRAIATSATILMMTAASAVQAQTTFIPPSDLVGQVFSTNSNDAYNTGRGVVFAPTSNYNLTGFGLFQNLTNITLNYTLSVAANPTGSVGGGTLLRSGSVVANTAGLRWIDFAITPLTLLSSTYYHLEFKFNGNANQNFFYNQSGAEPYAQAGFTDIDGTQGGNTANYVIPGIRLNGNATEVQIDSPTNVVPEPSSYALMGAGLAGVFGVARRRRQNA